MGLPLGALSVLLIAGMASNEVIRLDRQDNLSQQNEPTQSIETDNPSPASSEARPKPSLKIPGSDRRHQDGRTVDHDAKTPTSPAHERLDDRVIPNDWIDVTVQSGDNLSLIFDRLALDKGDMYTLLSSSKDTASLTDLYPGQTLRFSVGSNGELRELFYEQGLTKTLHAWRIGAEFSTETTVNEPDTTKASAAGWIDNSLFLDGQAAGLSGKVIMQLVEIFGWDIDFALDLREGDSFAVIYEELAVNGNKVGDGDILTAEFVNQGKQYRAVRYIDQDGNREYYTDEGRSLRKAFLRTPVNFTRISSHFDLNRKHPILNRIRAHRGVDYAAPQGTPVKTTGNGKIVSAGINGGYGKAVVIQHGEEYSTLYGHLTGFAKGINPGAKVQQGDVIGYVGQTGLATGPHLHYEFRVYGAHQNPLTVELPKTIPLPDNQLARFWEQTGPLAAMLEETSLEPTQKLVDSSSTIATD